MFRARTQKNHLSHIFLLTIAVIFIFMPNMLLYVFNMHKEIQDYFYFLRIDVRCKFFYCVKNCHKEPKKYVQEESHKNDLTSKKYLTSNPIKLSWEDMKESDYTFITQEIRKCWSISLLIAFYTFFENCNVSTAYVTICANNLGTILEMLND